MLYTLLLVATASAVKVSFDKANDPNYVITPLGYRPKQCVHMIEESNHMIRHAPEGTYVEYFDTNRTVFHPELPECVEDARRIAERLALKREMATSNVGGDDSILRAWDVYAGWYPGTNMGNFTVEYALPNENMKDYGQIVYYFIGMQNNGQAEVTIIQPVITYCNSGCDPVSAIAGWSGTSWNCCPGGQSHFAKPIALSAGVQNVFGYAYSDASAGSVEIYTEYNGQKSDLHITSDTRKYNWIDVTLEAYNYAHCDSLNSSPFYFNDMTITEENGNSVTSPKWDITSGTCQGSINFSNGGLTANIIGDGE